MKPTRLLDQATTPDGTPLTLHEHDGTLFIRVGGVELMSTRQHHSEERLAELACAGLHDRSRAAVLIGGLGLGFTLRETLRHVAADAAVVVAELVPAVIAWNRNPAFGLAADLMDDPRVTIVCDDVADVLAASRGRFDSIMLDVDNGATGLTAAANDGLYAASGLGAARAALKPGGRLAVITFHSLEDRMVREFMKAECRDYDLVEGADADLPHYRIPRSARACLVNRKAILPSEAEIRKNPRARSAKLRGFQIASESVAAR